MCKELETKIFERPHAKNGVPIMAYAEKDALDSIRRWLSLGATIRAIDQNRVLEVLPDGTVYGGLHIVFPAQEGEYKTVENHA